MPLPPIFLTMLPLDFCLVSGTDGPRDRGGKSFNWSVSWRPYWRWVLQDILCDVCGKAGMDLSCSAFATLVSITAIAFPAGKCW